MSAQKLGLSTLIALVLAASCLAEPAMSAPRATRVAKNDKETHIAQNKRTKRKNKRSKKKDSEDAPATDVVVDNPEKGDLHKEQEGSAEEPYSWEVGLNSDFVINKTQTGDAKGGSADYGLDLRALKVLSHSAEVGGDLGYAETSQKTKDATNTSRNYLVSLIGAYNFGDLDHDKMLFFVFGKVGIGGGSSKIGDKEVKTSQTQYGLGLGVRYFVDSNVALTSQFSYEAGESKADGADESTKLSSLHLAQIGFSLFL